MLLRLKAPRPAFLQEAQAARRDDLAEMDTCRLHAGKTAHLFNESIGGHAEFLTWCKGGLTFVLAWKIQR